MILGCRLCLPPEIEREITVLEFSLPDAEQLGLVLNGILESEEKIPRPTHREAILSCVVKSVLAAVKEAGAGGITIKEIAGKLGRNTGAIHTWFFNAKKAKRKDVKKIGEAKWQWVG